jgi:hypothetical protein
MSLNEPERTKKAPESGWRDSLRTLRLLPAWFAGIDLRLLAKARSDQVFYTALGATVVLLACGNGFALAVAAGYMLGLAPGHLWWLGAAWAIILAGGIERLVLQLPSTRRRWLLVVLLPRLTLSLLLAVQLGEPLMLRINEGAINNRLSIVQAADLHKSLKKATTFYAPKIKAKERQIARIRSQDTALQNAIEHYRFRSNCESDTPSCSYTGKRGCYTFCKHYAHVAANRRAELRARRRDDANKIADLQADVAYLRARQKAEIQSRRHAITGDRDLIAREEALRSIEKAHPEVAAEVWFLRVLFISLDLLPLAMKVLRMLSVESPYEALAAAARRSDTLAARREDERARVEERRVLDQGSADVAVNHASIWLEAEQKIREAEAASFAGSNGGDTRAARERSRAAASN